MGPETFRFYSAEMNARVFQQLLTEHALKRAIEEHQLVVHYQPRIGIAENRLVGVEALVRWVHPERGLISPTEFIPIAEEIGVIRELGKRVLQTACEQAKRWQLAGLPSFKVSVNVSPRQLEDDTLMRVVTEVLKETGLDSRFLELEVTETGLMTNMEPALDTLATLRSMGIGISIDDFGTGYSSLAHLKRLPVNSLKIDRSFVRDLGIDPDDEAIVTATLALAKSMQLRVVAEGVMEKRQVEFLIERGCDELQGYYFSPPLQAEELEAALRQGHWVDGDVLSPTEHQHGVVPFSRMARVKGN